MYSPPSDHTATCHLVLLVKSAQENFAEEASFPIHKMGHTCKVNFLHTVILAGCLLTKKSAFGLSYHSVSRGPLGTNSLTQCLYRRSALWVPWSMSAPRSNDPTFRDLHHIGFLPGRVDPSPPVIFAPSY